MSTHKHSKLILIVDDSPETLGMLNEALEREHITTLVALEGKQALTIAQKMTPDLILLDALMPQMDGFETCLSLKADAHLKHIPIIFMTGLSDTASVVKGYAVGGVDYVTKPIKPDELIARINVHLVNAQATLGAQAALDDAGQNLLAVNSHGNMQWSTPGADCLLARASELAFSEQVARWLSRLPSRGSKLSLSSGADTGCTNACLAAIYFGKSRDDTHLLRLVDDKKDNEIPLLRSDFGITHREAEVLLWIARGKTNRDIAQILDMSPRTVNKHLEQLFKKLNVDNRTLAAATAIRCLQSKYVW